MRDSNEASWTQVLEMLEFMSDATSVPILLDGDTGYGNFNNLRRLVAKLEQRGVAAVFCGKIKAGKDAQREAHSGSSNLRMRCHLGLDVPEPDKARLRVGTEWRTWSEGKAFAFDDAFQHEVVHEGDRDRVVLVVDVWHPGLSAADIAVLSHPVFQRFGKVAG